MKKLALFSLLGLMALTANAQTAPNDSTVTISGAKSDAVEHVQPMSPDTFSRFTGSYELSNGNSLALFTRGLKKYAAFHGEAWHEIVATSANSFVSTDRRLKINIYREDGGDVHGDVYIPRDTAQTVDGKAAELVMLALH